MNNATGMHVELSLRDYFAGQALEGELASQDDNFSHNDKEKLAKRCYAIADAMMKERNKSDENGAYDHA